MMSEEEKKYKNKNWLHEQYIDLNKTYSEIGKECNCHYGTIQKWIHEFDLMKKCVKCRAKLDFNRKKYCDACNPKLGMLKHLKQFMNETCKFGPNLMMNQEIFLSEFNDYLKKHHLNFFLKKNRLTLMMKKLGFYANNNQTRTKYQGLKFKNDDKKLFENKDLTHENICKVLSCQKTVNEFNELLLAFPHVDHEKVIKSIRAIEKIMFKKNIYRGVKTKIALAVWLSTNLTQDQVGEVLGISAATIRNLFHVVKRGVPIEMVNSDKIRFL